MRSWYLKASMLCVASTKTCGIFRGLVAEAQLHDGFRSITRLVPITASTVNTCLPGQSFRPGKISISHLHCFATCCTSFILFVWRGTSLSFGNEWLCLCLLLMLSRLYTLLFIWWWHEWLSMLLSLACISCSWTHFIRRYKTPLFVDVWQFQVLPNLLLRFVLVYLLSLDFLYLTSLFRILSLICCSFLCTVYALKLLITHALSSFIRVPS